MPGRVRVNIKVTHQSMAEIQTELSQVLSAALTLVGEDLLDRVAKVTGIRLYSLRELAKLGYPFSRLHGGGGFNKGRISMQSGMFSASFRVTQPVTKNGITSVSLVNDDPKAEWLRRGTRIATDRPYMREISKGLDKKFMEILLSALNPEYAVKMRGV